MYYPCGKFSDCSFSRFGSIMRTNRHTHADTHRCLTPATIVGMSNNTSKNQAERTIRCTGHKCCNISSDANNGDIYGLLAIRPVFEFSSGLLANCRNLAYVERYRSSESRDLLSTGVTAGGLEQINGIEELLITDEHL